MQDVMPLPPLDPDMDPSDNHYWTYHSLPTLLSCKKPLTASKDEDLFIAVHQICEIAFHQMIIDLQRCLDAMQAAPSFSEDGLREAAYFLERVNALWATVNGTTPILSTMRAFGEFRTSIGPTSGFQSFQFRRIEIMSGVDTMYWRGGTADASGTPHVAETTFDRVYGEDVQAWFEQYNQNNLRTLGNRLIALKRTDEAAGRLHRAFGDYDRAQLAFHRVHAGVAAVQLKKVGVEVGTGGTQFKTYLGTYERRFSPLFPELAADHDQSCSR
jgi:tryptophan 2,3-dioxygenase